MAPKKITGKSKKRARVNEQCQGNGDEVIEPNFEITHTNQYLFRDLVAYENYLGQFQERNLCECYYFDKSRVTFHPKEDNKTLEYISHWNWEPLINCLEPYLLLTTRTFYANLTYSDNPFVMSSWVCGKEIRMTLENVPAWLNLPNEGEETYLLRSWPRDHVESAEYYKLWFNKSNIFGAPIYATPLPSLHRLLFLFVNNILIPKSKIKTNIEYGPMYYLRHLIQLDTTTINIPYIILRHMQSAYRSTVASLPYAHVIHKIIRLNGIELPTDQPFFFPQHLVDQLTRIGWVQSSSDSGLMRFKPDGRDINEWIFHPEALPNQYWDPKEMAQDPPVHNQPANQPPFQYQSIPQAGQSVPFPPIPQSLDEQMLWMCQRMQEQHFNIMTMQEGMTRIEGQMQAHTKAIKTLDEHQESLTTRFVKRFGASSSSVPSTYEEEEEEGEANLEDVNEKVEEEDAHDLNPNQNPNE